VPSPVFSTQERHAYRVPGQNAPEKDKLGWVLRSISQGENHLMSQRAYEDMDRAIEIIAGKTAPRPERLSQLHLNRVKRQIREVVGTLSNLRPMWGYKSDNPAYDKHVEILNKLILSWWHNQFADRAIREALQYAAVLGTGYLSVAWERDLWSAGRGDVALKSHGPRDVLPVQMGSDNDLQRAYACIIKTEVPLAQAHAMYPTMAHQLTEDRDAPSWFSRMKERVQRFASPALNLVGSAPSNPEASPTVDIFNIYIIDHSINDTGADILMGDPGTKWSYNVPFVGKKIPTGLYAEGSGEPILHTVTPEEAMLYPRRRLITCTRTAILKDGPSPWWHGKVPIVQFRMDDWPWEFLGFSLTRDVASANDAANSLLRSVVDSANVRLRPPYQYDRSMVSKGFAERFDPRQPGARIEVDSSIGVNNAVAPIFDPSQFDVPSNIPEIIEGLEMRSDYLIGVQDLTALAKAQQTPSADSIEKLMEVAGPLVSDMSRNMERSLRDIGEMFKSMVFQFYTAARRVQILGPDGLTEEDFDFQPDDLVPSHFPWQHPSETVKPHHERAAWHQNNFLFHITPNSMHQITQMTRKLLFLQLQRSGVPIDPWTLAEVFDIPNFGKPPNEANTVIERWEAWQRIFAGIQASIMAQMQMIQLAQGPVGQMAGAMQAGMGADASQGGNPGPGRKPTGQDGPTLETKDQNSLDGPRTTVSES
jgi:hypothetical protein